MEEMDTSMEGGEGLGRVSSTTEAGSEIPTSENWSSGDFRLFPEILEQIFKHTDFERLKIYRTVCKTWNTEVCRVINSTVKLQDSDYIWHLPQVLKKGREMQLPVPIKNLRIMSPFKQNSLIPYLERLNGYLAITELNLTECPLNRKEWITKYATQVLTVCSNTLTDLKIEFWESAKHRPDILLRFPRLTNLTLAFCKHPISIPLDRYCEEESAFFLDLISASPNLKRLEFQDCLSMQQLLGVADLSKIQEFCYSSIHGYPHNSGICSQLKTVKIDKLTRLRLNWTGFIGNEIKELPSALSHFADTIQRIQVRELSLHKLLTCFPKLTHVEVASYMHGAWDPSLVPALRVVKLGTFFAGTPDKTIEPFPSVTNVSFMDLSDTSGQKYPEGRETEGMLGDLFNLFPNATGWSVPYFFVPEFIQAASAHDLNVERLRIPSPLFNSWDYSAGYGQQETVEVEDVRDRHAETFSTLHLLTGLKELELVNFEIIDKSVSIELTAIDFQSIPQLKKLRHYGAGLRGYPALKDRLRDLEQVEVVYDNFADLDMAENDLKYLTSMPNLTFDLGNISILRKKLPYVNMFGPGFLNVPSDINLVQVREHYFL